MIKSSENFIVQNATPAPSHSGGTFYIPSENGYVLTHGFQPVSGGALNDASKNTPVSGGAPGAASKTINDILLSALIGGGSAATLGLLGSLLVNKKTESPEERRGRLLRHALGWGAAGAGTGALLAAGLNAVGISPHKKMLQIYDAVVNKKNDEPKNVTEIATPYGIMPHDPSSVASWEGYLARITPSQTFRSWANWPGAVTPGIFAYNLAKNTGEYFGEKNRTNMLANNAFVRQLTNSTVPQNQNAGQQNAAQNQNAGQGNKIIFLPGVNAAQQNAAQNQNAGQNDKSVLRVLAEHPNAGKVIPAVADGDRALIKAILRKVKSYKSNQTPVTVYKYDPSFNLSSANLPQEAENAIVKARVAADDIRSQRPSPRFKFPFGSLIATAAAELAGRYAGKRLFDANAVEFINSVKTSPLSDEDKKRFILALQNNSVHLPSLIKEFQTAVKNRNSSPAR